MAATHSHNDDSDSEFGYDFTPEDEQLLLQLASPPVSTTAPVAVNPAIRAIDTVPGRTEVIRSGSEDVWGHHCAHGHFPPSDAIVSVLPPEVESRCMPSPLPLGEDISYPDRRYLHSFMLTKAD